MANGKIRFGKQSGGELALVFPDGVDNTEVVFPESGDLVNKQYVDAADYLQPSMTANATLTGINNKIVMNGIVTSLGLEVGDVIQFTSVANANNQKMRTVESIINNNEIIVNYEHCGSRGNGTLKLTDETLTNATIKRISKGYNAPLGLGQALVKVSTNRGQNTTYTNTSGRPIQVMTHGYFSNGICDIYINGNLVKAISSGSVYWVWNFDSIIPVGTTYSITGSNNTIANWEELR